MPFCGTLLKHHLDIFRCQWFAQSPEAAPFLASETAKVSALSGSSFFDEAEESARSPLRAMLFMPRRLRRRLLGR